MKSILIVEDDITYGMILKTWLGKKDSKSVRYASYIRCPQKHIEAETVDLILSRLAPARPRRHRFAEVAGRTFPAHPSYHHDGLCDIQSAVQAMKLGACDTLQNP